MTLNEKALRCVIEAINMFVRDSGKARWTKDPEQLVVAENVIRAYLAEAGPLYSIPDLEWDNTHIAGSTFNEYEYHIVEDSNQELFTLTILDKYCGSYNEDFKTHPEAIEYANENNRKRIAEQLERVG